MRRPRWTGGAAVAAIGAAALSVPSPASATLLDEYQRLAARRLNPAPLVPTTVPSTLAPIERTIQLGSARSRRGYALRLVHTGRNGPDAVIALERDAYRTLAAGLRDHRRQAYRAKPTRVRGRRGYVLTRTLGPTTRVLLWAEDGRVYTLGTGTPRTVSLKQLRATADGLDHLERAYLGSATDEDAYGVDGVLVTTEHTVTGHVSWSTRCVTPDGTPAAGHGGAAEFAVLPRRGGAFTVDVAQHLLRPQDPWSGSVSGTITPDAITLGARMSGPFDGATCDTGQVTVVLDQRPLD